MNQQRIPAVLMRGGDSKGLFFHGHDLPSDREARDRLLLRAMGSPDPGGLQLDGLGSAAVTTSLVAIVEPGSRPECDADFTVGRVAVEEPVIDYSAGCDNLAAAAAYFVIEERRLKHPELWEPGVPYVQPVRLWQASTRQLIVVDVPCQDGEPMVVGHFRMRGVPAPGARVAVRVLEPFGEPGGRGVLPLGDARVRLEVPGLGGVDVTVVDAGSPFVLVRAQDVGLAGNELPAWLDRQPDLLRVVEVIRASVAVDMRLAATVDEASRRFPAMPRLVLVAPTATYETMDGRRIDALDYHLQARLFSHGRPYPGLTATARVALAAAAAIPGTLVHDMLPPDVQSGEGLAELVMGHPGGLAEMGVQLEWRDRHWQVLATVIACTARRLMEGGVCIPLI